MPTLFFRLCPIAGEMTFFKGVKKLLPGRYLIWKDGKLEGEELPCLEKSSILARNK